MTYARGSSGASNGTLNSAGALGKIDQLFDLQRHQDMDAFPVLVDERLLGVVFHAAPCTPKSDRYALPRQRPFISLVPRPGSGGSCSRSPTHGPSTTRPSRPSLRPAASIHAARHLRRCALLAIETFRGSKRCTGAAFCLRRDGTIHLPGSYKLRTKRLMAAYAALRDSKRARNASRETTRPSLRSTGAAPSSS